MSRLPTVGGDSGAWGTVLNDYLSVSLTSGGGIKPAASGIWNVKDPAYGALGDNSNDDTAEIQAAIDAASSAGGGTVFFPPGTYITTTLLVPSKITLLGAGIGNTILKLKSAAGTSPSGDYSILLNSGWASAGNTDITVAGIEFDGNVTNNHVNEFVFGAQWRRVKRMLVRDCYFHDWRSEGMLWQRETTGNNACEDVLVSNCLLYNTGSNNDGAWTGNRRQGFAVVSGKRILFQNISAELCHSFAIDLEGSNANDVVQNCIIDGLSCYDCNSGVAVSGSAGGAVDCIVSNVTMRDGPTLSMTQGIHSEGGTTRLIVDNFTADSNFVSNICDIDTATDLILSGINATGVTGVLPGIKLANCTRAFVTGCSIRGGGSMTYAVQEMGTSNSTVVMGNYALAGATGPVLFLGALSYLGVNGSGTGIASIRYGTGTPESVVTAPIGSLFMRLDGSTSTTLYVKTSGTGNTGWTAK